MSATALPITAVPACGVDVGDTVVITPGPDPELPGWFVQPDRADETSVEAYVERATHTDTYSQFYVAIPDSDWDEHLLFTVPRIAPLLSRYGTPKEIAR